MAQHNSDLLSQGLGSKQKESGESSSSSAAVETAGNGIVGNTVHDKNSTGDDILSKVSGTGSESSKKDESKETKGSSESSGVKDPDTWTLENALKEVKKTREEAKTYRIKYQEMIKAKEEEYQQQLEAEKAKYQEAIEAKKKLEELEAKEADKKRSLEEKVLHRDKEIVEAQTRLQALENTYKQQLEAADLRIKELQAEQEAQLAVYKERLDEELAKIPDDKREFANLIVKGAGDSRDALIALNEAKIKGFFDEKKVVVSHAVPGAHDGARVSQQQLDAQERERRAKLTPQQLIQEGLKQAGRVSTPKMGKNSII